MSSECHVQVQSAPGKHPDSAEPQLYHCPKIKELIRMEERTVFLDKEALYQKLVKPLNDEFGAETHHIRWEKNNKYVVVGCCVKGCKFSVLFGYELSSTTFEPMNLKW